MQTTHTPGPWAIWRDFDEEGDTGRLCIGPNGSPIAATCGEGSPLDARLIAAAPAMLEALTLLLNVEGAAKYGARLKGFAGLDVSYHFDAARAAIAAATGEQ